MKLIGFIILALVAGCHGDGIGSEHHHDGTSLEQSHPSGNSIDQPLLTNDASAAGGFFGEFTVSNPFESFQIIHTPRVSSAENL
ncbi:unnamed protein product [Cyprideis torosa]|uniref:Uncharacterized protein n=1 Tax=Cyprideis torosa TaxID=163714 RepID=A0A7R8WKL1_9CRUS|nr:unnamed protein product [Cyprideis torosa]CAG0903288.1 unnamed protein product [Cyprideis torosa]